MAWFQVKEEVELPRGVCSICTGMALAALHFRKFCRDSEKQWALATSYLAQITTSPGDGTYFLFYDEVTVLKDRNHISSVAEATDELNRRSQPARVSARKPARKTRKPRKGVRWKCEDCAKEFRLPFDLNEHLKMSMKRACTHCGLIVKREKLHQHLDKVHNVNLFHCTVCHDLFQEQMELVQHNETAHGVLSHVCDYCKRGFVNHRALQAHMYAHTLFHCQSCNGSFDNRRCYKHHIKRCSGSKRPPKSLYECHDCGSKYLNKESLRTHIEQKHLRVLPYICQDCGKRSSTLGHHKTHEAIHLPKRKVFQCHCGARMLTELGFSLHQRIHSGEKPYECRECGDRFLSSSRRLDHIKRRHTNTKDMPHSCTKCAARYIRPSQLRKHYQVAHGGTS